MDKPSKTNDLTGIIDVDAYNETLKLLAHPIIKNPHYTTSEGVVLNIAQLPHQLRKKIEHLPLNERSKIEKLKALYFTINNNLTIQKRKAYGKKQGYGADGTKNESMLEPRKEELLEYFGRMFTVNDVVKIVNTDWAIPVGKGSLQEFKLKYAEEIKKRIDNHQISFHNIRLGIKKSRLEELSELYNKAKNIWTDNVKREDLRILLTILEQIRKEAEGDRLTIDGKVDIKYEQNIQVHLMKEVFATTNLKEIILGRVAAKMGINPIKLIYSLQNSYYKQYSNVLGDFGEDGAEGELPYPSQLNYDFERIGRNFNLKDQMMQDAVIFEESKNKNDLGKGLSLKEMLAAKLKSKTENLQRFSTKLDILDEQHKDK